MGSISILLADDSITIQKVVGIIFGSDEYSLTVVDNGTAAVEKAREIKPDILLVDALMPGLNGYEVCEAIRKEADLATSPILLMTGSFEPFDEEKARKCGADDHIVKPFESQGLIAKVQSLLELGRNRSTAVSEPPVASVAEAESTIAAEPFAFEQTAFEAPAELESAPVSQEEYTFSFSTSEEVVAPVVEPVSAPEPVRTPDDPWGAFTTPEPAAYEATIAVDSAAPFPQNNFMAMVPDEPVAAEAAQDQNIGASWVPVEEQTFEFSEDVAVEPETTIDEVAAESSLPEPEPEKQVEVPSMSMSPAPESPVAVPVSATAVALTDEQLLQAVRAASKETIERIVWEVVPDLAETMIKEAIKRITDGQ